MKSVKLSGVVTRFKGNGRKLGYPTANIRTDTDLNEGVYFGFSDLSKFVERPSLIFIGVPKTMGDHEKRIEVHVLDIPDEDYYGNDLSVKIMHFHRHNRHFASVDELIKAMDKDDQAAKKWFKAHGSLSKKES